MRFAGFGIFALGLTVASWYAAYVPEGTGAERIGNFFDTVGLQFGLGFAAMLVGVAMARFSKKRDDPASESEGAAGDAAGAMKQVQLIADRLAELTEEELTVERVAGQSDQLAAKIDLILSEEVPTFLDARLEIIEKYGLETFAELIGHFAVMERATARAWSAITDHAWDEVPPSIEKAQAAIARALEVARAAKPS